MFNTFALKSLLNESKLLLLIAIPLVFSGMIESSLGFFSTIFLAHLGQKTLAAGALVNWVYATLLVVIWGTMSAISTIVSYHYGAKNYAAVARVLRDSLFLVLIITIPCMLLVWNLSAVLLLFGQDPEIIALTLPYLHCLTWAIFPDFIFTVLLQFVMGLGHVRTNLFFTILWAPVHLLLSYIMVFGKFGLLALGMVGICWGAIISSWLITISMVIYLLVNNNYHLYRQHLIHNQQSSSIKELLRVGLPIGFMFCIEVGFFTCITLLMGTINNTALAANQIALQFITHISVVSFSLANAITIRMGHRMGEKDHNAAKLAGYLGILIAVVFMCLFAIIYWGFPMRLIDLDFNLADPANQLIIQTTKKVLAICAFFQIFDSIRITSFGALRALKDTRFTLLISIVTFWLIAAPLGYILAIKLSWQAEGIWWGMVFGQVIGASILFFRYCNKINWVTLSVV